MIISWNKMRCFQHDRLFILVWHSLHRIVVVGNLCVQGAHASWNFTMFSRVTSCILIAAPEGWMATMPTDLELNLDPNNSWCKKSFGMRPYSFGHADGLLLVEWLIPVSYQTIYGFEKWDKWFGGKSIINKLVGLLNPKRTINFILLVCCYLTL